jgi:hypothetical protein
MRRHRRCWSGWAAWLGVIALGLNALVPIHFAFDLVEAFEPAHHAPAGIGKDGRERQLLALICGHQEGGGEGHHHGKRGHPGCPVCAAGLTLVGVALSAGVALPIPNAVAAPPEIVAVAADHHGAPTAAYRSRAPPVA